MVPRGERKARDVKTEKRSLDITCSDRSREAPHSWCHVGREKQGMSKRKGEISTTLAAIGHAKQSTRGAALVKVSKFCQKYNVKHIPVMLERSEASHKKVSLSSRQSTATRDLKNRE